jgi:hypothetical protein
MLARKKPGEQRDGKGITMKGKQRGATSRPREQNLHYPFLPTHGHSEGSISWKTPHLGWKLEAARRTQENGLRTPCYLMVGRATWRGEWGPGPRNARHDPAVKDALRDPSLESGASHISRSSISKSYGQWSALSFAVGLCRAFVRL